MPEAVASTSPTTPETLLRDVFGLREFRGQQRAVIDAIVEGCNALVLMPTGGGKSLCYQIPALLRPGTAVVVSPLIALMRDQVAALERYGVRAACLHTGLDDDDRRAIEQQLDAGELDLLYLAPERLLSASMLARLERIDLALFAIDEAHCVSQWGHAFRPEYMQLSQLGERFPAVPRLALTATADARTRGEIQQQLLDDDAGCFIDSFDRPNIHYQVGIKDRANDQLLAFIRKNHPNDAGIVYCLSRKRTEAVAEWLTNQGLTALPYHAGLSAQAREDCQTRFLREDGIIIVATVAFGMGIDKPDVRFVAHLDLPKSLEAYYQETGRAGRDGQPANAWLVYSLQDIVQVRQLIARSEVNANQQQVERERLETLLAFCESRACRHQELLRYFGESHPGDCGQCDNCQSPPESWDATEAARKALSCVYRSGQRFGAAHTSDILVGHKSPRVAQLGHDKLSTFGIGSEHPRATWLSVIRQLLARGHLQTDADGHGGLQLSDSCRPLLRGEESLLLRRDQLPRKKHSRSDQADDDRPANDPAWEALRQCRRDLAQKEGVPPYVIFHDATLAAMLRHAPTTLDELAQVPGIGQHKLKQYGRIFLRVLTTLDEDDALPVAE
ncbi:ATP-dependent DNA helicase RecQ [Methylohalomonas lacus]|uniref:DNA helicase RecQ n=1 Tax=Methylohalomonas lacus TaxID=398773 RepID=A0AAE3L0Q8_9GAMM|nr:DNA helicase RecQ [Methylohalomonas lacus]MCS3902021.1 ATP-dependent DNA helicase RecQ [Methylohalomonas lacus]